MRKLAQYILQKNLVGVKFEGLLSKEYWIHSLQYLRKKLFDLSIGLFHYSNIPLLFRAFIMGLVVCILCFSNNARAQNLAPEFASIETMVGDSLGASINQAGSDSVNIRQMVQDQIEAARKKQLEEQSQAQLLAATKAKESNTQVMESFFVNVRKGIPLSDDLLIKILILGSAGILVSIVIIIRRRSMKKGAGDKELKRNIKLLREEKIPGKKNKKLSGIRSKLAGAPSTYELSSRAVARNAREMNIAKGEIYLAARIKSHEINKTGGRK